MTSTIDAPPPHAPAPEAPSRVIVRRLPTLDELLAPLPAPAPTAAGTAPPDTAPPETAPPATTALPETASPVTTAPPGAPPPATAPPGIPPPAPAPPATERPGTERPATVRPGTALAIAPTIDAAATARLPDGPGSLTELTSVLRMMLEVLDGRRPPAQLANRVTPPVRRYLTAAVGRLDRAIPGRPTVRPARCGPPGLRSVRACRPADGVCEVSAGWHYRGRHRALAARFEWRAGRWSCTALRLG